MKTEFQRRFCVGGEFYSTVYYSAEQIRKAVEECFPFRNGVHQGLARITFRGRPTHADSKLDFIELIPDIKDIPELPVPLLHNFCYGIIEGIPRKQTYASTFFVLTDSGYICDEMILPGNYTVHSEKIIPVFQKFAMR